MIRSSTGNSQRKTAAGGRGSGGKRGGRLSPAQAVPRGRRQLQGNRQRCCVQWAGDRAAASRRGPGAGAAWAPARVRVCSRPRRAGGSMGGSWDASGWQTRRRRLDAAGGGGGAADRDAAQRRWARRGAARQRREARRRLRQGGTRRGERGARAGGEGLGWVGWGAGAAGCGGAMRGGQGRGRGEEGRCDAGGRAPAQGQAR